MSPCTSHDIAEEVEPHGHTQDMVDERGLDGLHAVLPLGLEPVPAALYTFLHYICYTGQKHTTTTGSLTELSPDGIQTMQNTHRVLYSESNQHTSSGHLMLGFNPFFCISVSNHCSLVSDIMK